RLVEREQRRGGRVAPHRAADFPQVDAAEEALHVVDGVDRAAHASHLAARAWAVRVVAHLRGEVESGRQPRLARGQEVAEALVRFLGGSEPGILAHGPEPTAVHGGLHAARVRILSRKAQLLLVIAVARTVERLQLDAARGLEFRPAQRPWFLRRLPVHLARPSLERRLDPLRAAGHGRLSATEYCGGSANAFGVSDGVPECTVGPFSDAFDLRERFVHFLTP